MRLEDVLEKVRMYRKEADLDVIKRAYIFAALHHGADKRRSGEPFIVHPLEVAGILADMKCDEVTVATGLLHDVVEDTSITTEDIRKYFGDEIAFLVDSVTKVESVAFQSREEKQAEAIRKVLLAMARDVRVILVKLSDRLHNMRTIMYLNEDKRRAVAEETLEVYAPLAHRLGIYWLKTELEDRAFEVLRPEEYAEISKKINSLKKEKEKYIQEMCSRIQSILKREGIKCEVQGRFKSPYSIYRKMLRDNLTFEEVYDVIAFRVLVDTVRDCYSALGVIHLNFKPIFERFRDYISRPKPNNYRSLHTTVVGEDGQKMEIQIRTYEMHREAEEGVAAHWTYKEGKGRPEELQIYAWLRRLLEMREGSTDPVRFVSDVKEELFSDQVFVFTPKGDVVELPRGATPVDFAYAIHTEVGHRCIGAEVNGRMVPLDTPLEVGDRVRIITGKEPNPKKAWLAFVKTGRARSKIRAWINAKEREGLIRVGRSLLVKDLKKRLRKFKKSEMEKNIEEVAHEMGFKDVSGFYAAIGAGKISIHTVLHRLLPKEGAEEAGAKEKQPSLRTLIQRWSDGRSEIIVDGMTDVYARFARCCNPLPGEPIVGHVSVGRGLVIHSARCSRIEAVPEERLVPVRWGIKEGTPRKTKLKIYCEDRPGVLASISHAISKENINISDVSSRAVMTGRVLISLSIEVVNFQQLRKILKTVEMTKGVLNVQRV